MTLEVLVRSGLAQSGNELLEAHLLAGHARGAVRHAGVGVRVACMHMVHMHATNDTPMKVQWGNSAARGSMRLPVPQPKSTTV